MMTSMMQDIRYAVRQFRKAPAFTLTAVLTLALGIGATAAMYSVVRDVLLAPLPYSEQEQLVGVAFASAQEKPNNSQVGTGADFVAQHTRSFVSVGVADDGTSGANLSIGSGGGAHAFQIMGMRVSGSYFPTLGIRPALGRGFTAEEDVPNGPKVVLLSDALWRRAFNADRKIVDSVIRVNEEPYTVVGVMPPSLSLASESTPGQASVGDVWTPLRLSPNDPGYEGDNFQMIARLKPGVNLEQAQQELNGLKEPFYQQNPSYRRWAPPSGVLNDFKAWPLQQVIVSEARTSLLTMLAAVVAVLLVACLNLGVMMTARASQRAREIALRTALGATRGSVLWLMMTESLLLALAGGGLGLLLARVATPMLLAASPMAIPHLQRGSGMPVLFVLVVACATTVLFGLLPALGVFRQDANRALQLGTLGGSVSQVRLGKALMVGQIAVAMVLLSTASLLLGSFLKLRAVPSGVLAKRLTIAQVTLKGETYASTQHTTQFIEKVMAGLEPYPGIKQVAAVNGLPLDRGLNTGGHPTDQPSPNKGPIEFRAITPDYFRTLGIALLQGRDIAAGDHAGAAHVALISEEAARQWWHEASPLGRQVVLNGKGQIPMTVVGVVADTRSHSLAETPRIIIYAPFAQLSDEETKTINGWFPTTFTVRTAGDVDVAAAIQRAVSTADADVPVAKITTMQAVIDHTVAGPAFFAWLASGFAVFALLLTIIGLFGLLSYQVTQRTRELGVRLALGAQRSQVLGIVVRRGLVLMLAGLAVGITVSMVVPRIVGSVLSDYVYTGRSEPGGVLSSTTRALSTAALAMLLATLTASYLPARRASRIEPIEALRTE